MDGFKLVTDAGLPMGVAQIMHADGTYTFGFDPAFTLPKKNAAKALVKKGMYRDAYGYRTPYDKYAVWRNAKESPLSKVLRKTESYFDISKLTLAMQGFGDAIEGSMTGFEKLKQANDEWEREVCAAKKEARLAITEEKVHVFMEQHYLPYDYARHLLEKAYTDDLLVGKKETTV